jgi:hypothetical protein
VYSVSAALRRSPLASKAMAPVTPWYLILASAGRNLAGSDEFGLLHGGGEHHHAS